MKALRAKQAINLLTEKSKEPVKAENENIKKDILLRIWKKLMNDSRRENNFYRYFI